MRLTLIGFVTVVAALAADVQSGRAQGSFFSSRYCAQGGGSLSSGIPDCSFHTWLYRIVTNICLDHLRKRKVRKEEPAVLETADGPVDRMDGFEEESADSDPERRMWNRELSRRIEAALTELTARERMVFELRHYQGLRLRNIGDMLGTSEEAAKNCLFRATQKMRAGLGEFV